jgi:hypothetical protein
MADMAQVTADTLASGLSWDSETAIFGVAYSIITTTAIVTAAYNSPNSVSQTLRNALAKSIANGHAVAFLLTKGKKGKVELVKTAIGGTDDPDKDAWDFEDLGGDEEFAKTSTATNTDVYYIAGSQYAGTFRKVRSDLEKKDVHYSELIPNWCSSSSNDRNENCVSSTHYIVYKMGLGWWGGEGYWIPSAANWLTWLACTGTSWRYKAYPSCNTLIEHKTAASIF